MLMMNCPYPDSSSAWVTRRGCIKSFVRANFQVRPACQVILVGALSERPPAEVEGRSESAPTGLPRLLGNHLLIQPLNPARGQRQRRPYGATPTPVAGRRPQPRKPGGVVFRTVTKGFRFTESSSG